MNDLKTNPTDLKVTGPKLGDAFNKMAGKAAALVESLMYGWCSKNVEGYNGGMWENVEWHDPTFYAHTAVYRRLMEDPDKKFKVSNPGAQWEGELSTDAMGMTATLYGLNFALWKVYEKHPAMAEELERAYYRLRDYAMNSPEAGAIYAATN